MRAKGSQVVRSDGPTLTRVFTPSPSRGVVEKTNDPIAPTFDCRNEQTGQPRHYANS